MTAGELRAILEHVPDDLPVNVRAGGNCCHVVRVQRHARRRNNGEVWPANIVLEGRFMWLHEPPAFTLEGPFRDRQELDEALAGRT